MFNYIKLFWYLRIKTIDNLYLNFIIYYILYYIKNMKLNINIDNNFSYKINWEQVAEKLNYIINTSENDVNQIKNIKSLKELKRFIIQNKDVYKDMLKKIYPELEVSDEQIIDNIIFFLNDKLKIEKKDLENIYENEIIEQKQRIATKTEDVLISKKTKRIYNELTKNNDWNIEINSMILNHLWDIYKNWKLDLYDYKTLLEFIEKSEEKINFESFKKLTEKIDLKKLVSLIKNIKSKDKLIKIINLAPEKLSLFINEIDSQDKINNLINKVKIEKIIEILSIDIDSLINEINNALIIDIIIEIINIYELETFMELIKDNSMIYKIWNAIKELRNKKIDIEIIKEPSFIDILSGPITDIINNLERFIKNRKRST